jgi:hypothetical protein
MITRIIIVIIIIMWHFIAVTLLYWRNKRASRPTTLERSRPYSCGVKGYPALPIPLSLSVAVYGVSQVFWSDYRGEIEGYSRP